MKKKILLFLLMFMFMTNVSALTFNVNIENIENAGNNGTIGRITNIDLDNKTVDAYFQDIGDEVNFSITITNSGDRAGTLREIAFEPGNDKIEYSSDLPSGGLAINGHDFNMVTIKAKVKEGAQNGKTTSEVKIKYTYDEGSCPDGEILSEDESMCLCPEGMERNEAGICVKPEKPVECAEDEIYNTEKKICEKKVIPVDPDKPTPKPIPSNPKTLDNIILITLLFFVSGLGIYAVLFKKLKTKKSKIVGATITGVATLSLSFTVLAGVFGLDNLLSAIVNPITKSKELVITVNEEIDLIETWDGNCDLDVAELTPSNIFDGGSGTESDPYQVKTAEQLSCFAKSVNNGTTYEGQYIKQTKNIKLNDHLLDQVIAGDLSNAHVWISAGDYRLDPAPYFAGTYDGDDKIISGLYITDDSVSQHQYGNYKGLFGYAVNATFKNMELSDVYMINTTGNYGYTGALLGYGYKNLTLDNIKTYGAGNLKGYSAGIVSYFNGNREGGFTLNRVENNIDLYFSESGSGIIYYAEGIPSSSTPNLVIKNTKNNGNFYYTSGTSSLFGGILGYLYGSPNVLVANSGNTGNFTFDENIGSQFGGIGGAWNSSKITLENCYNTGNFTNTGATFRGGIMGGLIGMTYGSELTGNNLYNSGNIDFKDERINFEGMDHYDNNGINPQDTVGGIFGYVSSDRLTLTNSYNTGHFSLYGIYVGGLIGKAARSADNLIENCYNTGDITSTSFTGGLVGYYKGTLTKSYNTGDLTIFAGFDSGGLIAQGERSTSTFVNNSYNTGDILVTTFGKQNQIGGICGFSCSIENSYNRGNMDFKHQPWSVGGIIGANAGDIKNVYNSGDILVEDIVQEARSYPSTMYVSGINGSSSYGTGSGDQNAYNLGNITASYNGVNNIPFGISGVSYANTSNSVNAGNITLTINQPYTESRSFYIAGISLWSKVTNSFNAGTITLDDSPLGHSIYDEEFTNTYGDTYKHNIYVGEINSHKVNGTTNNKYNTDPAKLPYYCPNNSWTTCTQEDYDTAGVYTTEETPSILSIINGDNAFNTELDEEGLPTLRVFNE